MRDFHAFGVEITLDPAQERTFRAKRLECAAFPRSATPKAAECVALLAASRTELPLVVRWGPLSGTIYSLAAVAYGEAIGVLSALDLARAERRHVAGLQRANA